MQKQQKSQEDLATCRCRTDIDENKPDSHENYAYALGDVCLTFKCLELYETAVFSNAFTCLSNTVLVF